MTYLEPGWKPVADFIIDQVVHAFSNDLLYWQWVSLPLCLLLCFNPWIAPERMLISMRTWLHRLAQNRSRAIFIAVLFPILVRVVLLPFVPVKPPSVHDEFSLLLMADTFHSGRLTNPTPPFWTHFETIHVIQKPTYASMYPPGLGVFLAAGEVIDNPWIGVLLSVGLMCGAACWMLQAWVPPAWAFGGALITALQIGIGGYWMNSYFGGATPAIAGALLFGAMPRFLRKPAWTTAAIFAAFRGASGQHPSIRGHCFSRYMRGRRDHIALEGCAGEAANSLAHTSARNTHSYPGRMFYLVLLVASDR